MRAQQWIGFFLPPVVFFAHLQLGYVLIPWACTTSQGIAVHIAGIVAVALSVAGNLFALRAARDTVEHTRMLGIFGLGIGALLTLILVAQWVAGFIVGVCQ